MENPKEIHEAITTYLKNFEGGLAPEDSYLSRMKSLRYKHRCLEWSSIVVPQQKKFKSNTDEVDFHLQKIQEHIDYLKCVYNEQKLGDKYFRDVNRMISQLQSLI